MQTEEASTAISTRRIIFEWLALVARALITGVVVSSAMAVLVASLVTIT